MPSQRRAIKGFPPYTQCTEQELHESRIEPRLYACENFTLQKHTPLSLFFTKCHPNLFYLVGGSVYFWSRKCMKCKVRRRQRRAGTQQKLNVFFTHSLFLLFVWSLVVGHGLGRQQKCLALPQNRIWKSLELFPSTKEEKKHNTKKPEIRKNDDSPRKLWQKKRLPLMVDVEVAVSPRWMMLSQYLVSFYTFVSRFSVESLIRLSIFATALVWGWDILYMPAVFDYPTSSLSTCAFSIS